MPKGSPVDGMERGHLLNKYCGTWSPSRGISSHGLAPSTADRLGTPQTANLLVHWVASNRLSERRRHDRPTGPRRSEPAPWHGKHEGTSTLDDLARRDREKRWTFTNVPLLVGHSTRLGVRSAVAINIKQTARKLLVRAVQAGGAPPRLFPAAECLETGAPNNPAGTPYRSFE